MTPKKEQPTVSDKELKSLAETLVGRLKEKNMTVTAAESCTGGLFAKCITDVPGASAVFPGSIVSYSNEVKEGILGVPHKVIERDTEVSKSCAAEMAAHAATLFTADYALSTTGYAGPGGGTDEHPVGTVYIGFHTPKGTTSASLFCPGATRDAVRKKAVRTALSMLLAELE